MGHASTQVTRRYAVQMPNLLGERAAEALLRVGSPGADSRSAGTDGRGPEGMLARLDADDDPRHRALSPTSTQLDTVPTALLRPGMLVGPATLRGMSSRAGQVRLWGARTGRSTRWPVSPTRSYAKPSRSTPRPPWLGSATLLGDHADDSRAGGGLEDRAPVLLDIVRRIVEEWTQSPRAHPGGPSPPACATG